MGWVNSPPHSMLLNQKGNSGFFLQYLCRGIFSGCVEVGERNRAQEASTYGMQYRADCA